MMKNKMPRIHYLQPETDLTEFTYWLWTHKRAAIDTESTGIDPYHRDWKLRLIQLGDDQDVFVIPVENPDVWDLSWLFEDTSRTWIGHNLSFDILCLSQYHGYPFREMFENGIDTRIKHHMLDSRHKGEGGIGQRLEAVAHKYLPHLGLPDLEKALKKEFKKIKVPVPGKTYAKGGQYYRTAYLSEGYRLIAIDNPVYVKYAAMDVAAAYGLDSILSAELDRVYSGMWKHIFDFEMKLELALETMSSNGMKVDLERAKELRDEINRQIESLQNQLNPYGIRSVYANANIAHYMTTNVDYQFREFTATGQPRLDKHILEEIANQGDPVARLILDIKGLTKRRTAYVDNIISAVEQSVDPPWMHPRILGLGARTARMSTSNPSLHHLPSNDGQIRGLFTAAPGHVYFTVDYNQIEMRIAAVEAGEDTLIEDINRGVSVHETVAQVLFGKADCPHSKKQCCYSSAQYKIAKNTGFGWLFGGGAKTLARQGDLEMTQALSIVQRFSSNFTKLNEFKRRNTESILDQALTPKQRFVYDRLRRDWFDADDEDKAQIKEQLDRLCYGKTGTVVTPMGRRILVDAKSSYAATNYIIQETARNVMAAAVIRVCQDSVLEDHVNMVIHDELLGVARRGEAKRIADEVATRMTVPYGPVTLEASGQICGKRWGDIYG